MNKTTIPVALIGIAAATTILSGCGSGSDDEPTLSGYSDQASAASGAADALKTSAPKAVKTDPVDEKFSDQLHVGDTIKTNGNYTLHIDAIDKVNTPQPDCQGQYFAVSFTGLNTSKYGILVDRPWLTSYDLAGNMNNDGQATVGQAERPDPLNCPAPDNPLPAAQRKVPPGQNFTVASYIRVAGLEKPVVIKIDSYAAWLKIPKELR